MMTAVLGALGAAAVDEHGNDYDDDAKDDYCHNDGQTFVKST